MIKITNDYDLLTLEPMKYQALGAGYTSAQKQEKINLLVGTKEYIYSLKTDGNYGRMIWIDGDLVLQTRGISKKTNTYGEVQTKVLFSDAMKNAFTGTTMLIGEIYLDGGIDKDVGTILRCLDDKALARQKEKKLKYRIFDCFYYNGESLLDKPIIERIKYLPQAAAAINHPLVSYVKYYEAKPENFWDSVGTIFANGGEGVVLYKKSMVPCEGRTSVGQTLKVKQELEQEIDCFITAIEPAKVEYTGKEIESWTYWLQTRGMEKIMGNFYSEYHSQGGLIPVTKSYFYDWPGAVVCSVMKNGVEYPLCKCSNLTDEFSEELSKNFDKYDHMPVKITGMMVSTDRNGSISIRHPRLTSIRENDISIEDCTFEKVIGGK